MAFDPAFEREMQHLLGDGWVRDGSRLEAYADEYRRRAVVPRAVAIPADRSQVQALVRACRSHGVALVARGAGTNTTGATVPPDGSIVVSFERMARILDIRPGDRCAVVEPGVV
ncbi:FAD-binding protein, partial [Luteimonas sp. 8-5]|uniref:FAD-binding oxidoreductase n=1 Tax=Luteimonas sp. 8-5 TaxID=3039387 RepID=UPI00243655D8